MKKIIALFIVLLVFTNCVSETKKANNTKPQKVVNNSKKNITNKKTKVGKNTYSALIKRTQNYANNLKFDLAYIRNKGLADKKYLAEFLGLYWKLNKAFKNNNERVLIKKRLQPYYEETLKSRFHNMATVNDKLFKKNSMSYMRIMWLLQELGFDISFYENELAKVQKRMDDHMKIRGEWQKAVFDKYYDFFKIDKPRILTNAKKLKGAIGAKKPLNFYNRSQSYVLTHFIFAAYDYGNKTTQNRFNKKDITYLKEILPQIIAKFELKRNDDLVGELLTCQVLIGDTKTPEFKQSYKRLIRRQNIDGSFGGYEKYRKKIGDDAEFRAYLHTTLVCLETFVEFEERKNNSVFD